MTLRQQVFAALVNAIENGDGDFLLKSSAAIVTVDLCMHDVDLEQTIEDNDKLLEILEIVKEWQTKEKTK